MLCMVHAKVAAVSVEGEDGADAILGIDVDVSRLGKGQVENLLEPWQT